MSLEKLPNSFLNLSELDLKGGERHFYRFKSFRLDVAERQLLREDTPVPLTPKAFDVLALLVERSGHLVEKEELLESVWAGSFVEEQNIARIIHTLRRALGEDENGGKYIETVAKKGYRFVAEVTRFGPAAGSENGGFGGYPNATESSGTDQASQPTLTDSGAHAVVSLAEWRRLFGDPDTHQEPISDEDDGPAVDADPSETSPAPAQVSKQGTRIVLFTVGFLSAVILLILLSFNFRSEPARSPNKVTSIAVLPVRPVNATQRDEVYETGIAESLINTLGPMKGLIVRPLSATRQYSDVSHDPLAAGREQKVDYVLASNYQIADGRIRITSQLFNVATGQIDDTYKSERDAADLFAMQDAIADEIGGKLKALFGITATGIHAKRGTNNEEAYRLYLIGKSLTMRRHPDAAKKAVEYLEQAIMLDPDFARAYALLARVTPNSESGKMRELINKALALDPNLADVYVARAEFMLDNWDFQSMEKDLAKALELEPNNDTAHWLSALLLAYRGRLDDALTEIDAAQAIDPGAVMYMFHRGRILYYARRNDEAIKQFRQAMEIDDRFVQPYGWTARIYENQGDHAAAFEFLRKREERSPRKDQVERFQKAYETGGWMGARLHLVETNESGFDLARLHALLGEKDAAFEYLNKAFERRSWLMLTLNVEPAFDSLRGDPRFDDLVKRVGLN